MLKLRGVPDLEESNLLVRLEHRVYAPWQAVAEEHDRPVNVLVDVEALAAQTRVHRTDQCSFDQAPAADRTAACASDRAVVRLRDVRC
jgi:hypothetical protein